MPLPVALPATFVIYRHRCQFFVLLDILQKPAYIMPEISSKYISVKKCKQKTTGNIMLRITNDGLPLFYGLQLQYGCC